MKKTNLVLGFMLIMLLTMGTSLMAQSYGGGSGSLGDPFIISTKAHLKQLSDNNTHYTGYYFKQTADITFESSDFESGGAFYYGGAGFLPIGDGNRFESSYDGNNKTIDGLYMNRSDDDVGLFAEVQKVWPSGHIPTIENIILTNVDITNNGSLTGGLIGQFFNGTISNCSVSGTVSGTSAAGGLVGQSEGGTTIQNSSSTATVSGGSYSGGGLVGYNNSTISYCYSTGNVSSTGDWSYTGGLAGYSSGSIEESYSKSNVSGEASVGGFIGRLNFSDGDRSITDCYCTGNVTKSDGSSTSISAFCGEIYYENIMKSTATLRNNYCTGNVNNIGGTNMGFVGKENLMGGGYIDYNDNFFDSAASNQSTATGATGKDTDAMKGITAGNTISDWDWSTDVWERIGNNYPRLKYNPDPTLPVVLSTFTAQFIENTPTIHWSTQSETDNLGWLIYRSDANEFSTSEVISNMIEGHGTTTQQQFYTYEDNLENPEVGDTYYYWLESIDYSGIINHYDNVAILTIPDNHGSTNNLIPKPERFGLLQNEPNPVINSTRIAFNLTETAQADLNIYNLKGQLVKKLYSGTTSKHTVMWNGKDEQGKALESGVYFYKLNINGKTTETKKLILMK